MILPEQHIEMTLILEMKPITKQNKYIYTEGKYIGWGNILFRHKSSNTYSPVSRR